MKRVALVTFHESDNFGTCLQAFALQEAIRDLGYAVEIVNYQRANIISQKRLRYLTKLIILLKSYPGLKILHYIGNRKLLKCRKENFREFRRNYFSYTPQVYHSMGAIEELNNNFDCFVCGSDMVWCSDRSDNLEVFFLRFADKNKRVSYAPSIGSDQIAEELEPLYKTMLSEMRFLSCREQGGVRLIESLAGRTAQLVVDPTILIDKAKWSEFADVSSENEKQYILCYLFESMTNNFYLKLKAIAHSHDLYIRFISMGSEKYSNKHNTDIDYGPIEFIRAFAGSKFIVTNSYHGLIFSLIFNKPFCVPRRKKGGHWVQFEDRLVSMLDTLGLRERFLDYNVPAAASMLEMDYSAVNDILDKMKIKSKEYLKSALATVMEGE